MDYTIEALRGGAMNFVRKPYSIGEILSVVNKKRKRKWLKNLQKKLRRLGIDPEDYRG